MSDSPLNAALRHLSKKETDLFLESRPSLNIERREIGRIRTNQKENRSIPFSIIELDRKIICVLFHWEISLAKTNFIFSSGVVFKIIFSSVTKAVNHQKILTLSIMLFDSVIWPSI